MTGAGTEGGTRLWRVGCGRLSAAGCVEGGDGPLGRRLWIAPLGAMLIKSSLRDYLPALILILTPGEEFWYM